MLLIEFIDLFTLSIVPTRIKGVCHSDVASEPFKYYSSILMWWSGTFVLLTRSV